MYYPNCQIVIVNPELYEYDPQKQQAQSKKYFKISGLAEQL